MATISYLVQTTDDPDGAALQASRESIAELGLAIDHEFVEQASGCFRDSAAGDFTTVAIDQRPVGRQLFASLAPGDVVATDGSIVPPKQLGAIVADLASRGVTLHATIFEQAGVSADQVVAFLEWYDGIDRRCRRMRAIESRAALQTQGRPTGRPPLGFKVVKDRRGRKRLAPDEEQRSVMLEIVKRRLDGWGWRRISSFLTKHRVMYKVPDRKARSGFRLEFWSFQRCERAYNAMIQILAQEELEKQAAGDQSEQPSEDVD